MHLPTGEPRNRVRDLNGKRRRAQTEGVQAWVDPEGYRRLMAGKRHAFENEVDLELGVKHPPRQPRQPRSSDGGAV